MKKVHREENKVLLSEKAVSFITSRFISRIKFREIIRANVLINNSDYCESLCKRFNVLM